MTSHTLPGPPERSTSPDAATIAPALAIRAARVDDIRAIVALHREAFANTFGGAFGRGRVERGVAAMITAWRRQGVSALRGMLVAEQAGTVVGTTALRTLEMGSDDTGVAELAFQEELGLWGATRSLFALSLLDHRIDRQEGFIADVAVLAAYQRSGVARALLARAEADARERNKRYLGLYVSADNTAARSLYQNIGFADLRVRHSFFARLFFGQGTWHYMRKNLV